LVNSSYQTVLGTDRYEIIGSGSDTVSYPLKPKFRRCFAHHELST